MKVKFFVFQFYSFLEFCSLYWCGRKEVTMWRQRTFYVLPPSVLRKCRLIGALIMLNTWLLLCYAVVKVGFCYSSRDLKKMLHWLNTFGVYLFCRFPPII